MLRNERRFEAVDKPLQRREMVRVGLACASERQSDAVKRKLALAAQGLEHREARAALDHVILGMDLEPKSHRRRSQRLAEMLRLEAKAGGGSHGDYAIGLSEPTPFGVLIDAQVPLATYFQALPW